MHHRNLFFFSYPCIHDCNLIQVSDCLHQCRFVFDSSTSRLSYLEVEDKLVFVSACLDSAVVANLLDLVSSSNCQ